MGFFSNEASCARLSLCFGASKLLSGGRKGEGNKEALTCGEVALGRRIEDQMDRKHGQIDYYLTQLLTGYGFFQLYLYTIGKSWSPDCIYG